MPADRGMQMQRESIAKEDLQRLGGEVHTYESFARSFVAAALANAADQVEGQIDAGTTITLSDVNVTISVLGRGFVLTCVWLPGIGRICHLDRPERDA
jgi:hypothetical protein